MPANATPGDGITDWHALIQGAFARRPPPVNARTYIRKWGSASRPVALSCDDNQVYVVKGKHAGRQAINDQIVAHLGEALRAPTGRPALVNVDQTLIDAERELRDLFGSGPFIAGVWHGSRHVGDVSDDREPFAHQAVPENRSRYAQLAILYGWAHSQDHQFLFAKAEPRMVYSVDHGHFFPGGPNWTIATLQAHTITANPDPTIVSSCGLTPAEIKAVGATFALLPGKEVIALATGAPLDEWGISIDERVAMAEHLARRFQELCGAIDALVA